MVFPKEFFQKDDFEKISRWRKSMKNCPGGKVLMLLDKFITHLEPYVPWCEKTWFFSANSKGADQPALLCAPMWENLIFLCKQQRCRPACTFMCPDVRKPDFFCKQQRCRPACTSVQSGQHLCCLIYRKYDTLAYYIQNFNILASLYSWAGWFVSHLVANSEDRPRSLYPSTCFDAFLV